MKAGWNLKQLKSGRWLLEFCSLSAMFSQEFDSREKAEAVMEAAKKERSEASDDYHLLNLAGS